MLNFIEYDDGKLSDYVTFNGCVVFIGLRDDRWRRNFYIYDRSVGLEYIIKHHKPYPYKEINPKFIENFKNMGIETC